MNRYLAILLGVLMILIFGYNLFYYALNIPSFDDYDATLKFIRAFYFEEGSFLQKLKLLFSFHNDHCILISRVAAAGYYSLFEEVNFARLVVFQNLFFLGFFAIVLTIMRSQKLLSPFSVVLVIIFLFNLSLWQVTFNYWGGIQTYTVFFFSFLSLFLLSKSDKPQDIFFIFAVMAVIFAVFSFGNGVLSLFLGGFLLWVRKKYIALAVWSFISFGLVAFIFMARMKTYSAPIEPFNLNWMARLLFTFLGSSLFVNPLADSLRYANILLCMTAGAGVLAFWIWLFFKGYPLKNPLLYALFSLPVLTGILIAISRFTTKAAGGISPRYMFFTATIPILIILILIDLKILGKQSLPYITFCGLVIWLSSFYFNRIALETYNTELVSVIRKWQHDDNTRLIYYQDSKTQSEVLHWALERNIVQLSDAVQEK